MKYFEIQILIKAYFLQFMKTEISNQDCTSIFSNPWRVLLLEGYLTLIGMKVCYFNLHHGSFTVISIIFQHKSQLITLITA